MQVLDHLLDINEITMYTSFFINVVWFAEIRWSNSGASLLAKSLDTTLVKL
jgi:hypothetical protein